ncbi:MAG: hypothetical protein R6X10_11785 [Desulfobacterales bacterium]
MPTPKSELYREAIRRSLMSRAGKIPDASVVAETTLNIWQQMSALLTPIIGMRGVDTLFNRSLHLTGKAFPWLAVAEDDEDDTALLVFFKARLAGSGTNDAIEASCALFVTFIELLSALIGESLTRRLLRPVWKWKFPSQKIEPETK